MANITDIAWSSPNHHEHKVDTALGLVMAFGVLFTLIASGLVVCMWSNHYKGWGEADLSWYSRFYHPCCMDDLA